MLRESQEDATSGRGSKLQREFPMAMSLELNLRALETTIYTDFAKVLLRAVLYSQPPQVP